MTKKYFTITYEKVGSVNRSKTDWCMIWSDSIANAVKEFVTLKLDGDFTYNEGAIISIKC